MGQSESSAVQTSTVFWKSSARQIWGVWLWFHTMISYHFIHGRSVRPSGKSPSVCQPSFTHTKRRRSIKRRLGRRRTRPKCTGFSFWRNRCPKKKGCELRVRGWGNFRSNKNSVESGGPALSLGLSLEGTLGFCGPLWLSSSPCYFDSVNWFGSRSLKQARQNVKTRWAWDIDIYWLGVAKSLKQKVNNLFILNPINLYYPLLQCLGRAQYIDQIMSLESFWMTSWYWQVFGKENQSTPPWLHVSILRSTMGVNSSQDPRFRILAAKAAGLFCQRPLHESPIPPPIPQTSALLPSTSSECCNDGWEDMRWWEKTDDCHRLLLHGSQRYPQAGVFFSSRLAPESIPCRDWKQSGSWVHGTMHSIQRCSVSKIIVKYWKSHREDFW